MATCRDVGLDEAREVLVARVSGHVTPVDVAGETAGPARPLAEPGLDVPESPLPLETGRQARGLAKARAFVVPERDEGLDERVVLVPARRKRRKSMS